MSEPLGTSAPEMSPAALGKPAALDGEEPRLSPVHDSPERKSLAASLANEGGTSDGSSNEAATREGGTNSPAPLAADKAATTAAPEAAEASGSATPETVGAGGTSNPGPRFPEGEPNSPGPQPHVARSPSPEAGTARSQLRGKSVSLTGFHHPMCSMHPSNLPLLALSRPFSDRLPLFADGKYALASTSCGWPRYTNDHGMHLYYQQPTLRWCLNVTFPTDQSVLTCTARQAESSEVPHGEQIWIEAIRTEDGGSRWIDRHIISHLVAGFTLGEPQPLVRYCFHVSLTFLSR